MQEASWRRGKVSSPLTGRNLQQIQTQDGQPSSFTSRGLRGQESGTNKHRSTKPSILGKTCTFQKDERHNHTRLKALMYMESKDNRVRIYGYQIMGDSKAT
ncbi:hypothetical protein AMECASPLE_011312 [Ameca splendens]|uniref:Uncharacterized protein n=1 Tax=Ameca splendens TaxID=208324 RepID=A0ABV1A8Q0_9TELE